MSDVSRELAELKEQIETAKEERNKIEGELRQLSKTMVEEFGTDNPEKIQAKITQLKNQAATLQKELAEGIASLREGLANG